MNMNTFKKLEFGQTVIVSSNEDPSCYFPAKIVEITKSKRYRHNSSSEPDETYKYSVRPINYEKNPFDNFPRTDTTFLSWDELASFKTVEDWILGIQHYLKDVIDIKKI